MGRCRKRVNRLIPIHTPSVRPTMRKSLLFFILAAFGWAQSGRFPSAVATDNDLMVAKNLVTTTSFPISSTATSITVASGTGFAVNTLLAVEREIMVICSVNGNTLLIGKTSCPNLDGRG